MARRILINTYRIAESERASFLSLARNSLKDQPVISGFGFQVYAHPEEHDYFAEIFLLPDPKIAGTKTTMEAYHFASSYQPERDSCIKIGSRLIPFRGEIHEDSGVVPLESAAIRYTPILVDDEAEEGLLTSLGNLARNREYQTQMLTLSSTEFKERFGLLEFFSTVDDFQRAESQASANEESVGEEIAAAHMMLADATIHRDDLPASFVRFQ